MTLSCRSRRLANRLLLIDPRACRLSPNLSADSTYRGPHPRRLRGTPAPRGYPAVAGEGESLLLYSLFLVFGLCSLFFGLCSLFFVLCSWFSVLCSPPSPQLSVRFLRHSAQSIDVVCYDAHGLAHYDAAFSVA